MDRARRRGGALAGAGAAIAGSSLALSSGLARHGAIAGLPAEFWRGVPAGVGIGMALVGVLVSFGVVGRRC